MLVLGYLTLCVDKLLLVLGNFRLAIDKLLLIFGYLALCVGKLLLVLGNFRLAVDKLLLIFGYLALRVGKLLFVLGYLGFAVDKFLLIFGNFGLTVGNFLLAVSYLVVIFLFGVGKLLLRVGELFVCLVHDFRETLLCAALAYFLGLCGKLLYRVLVFIAVCIKAYKRREAHIHLGIVLNGKVLRGDVIRRLDGAVADRSAAAGGLVDVHGGLHPADDRIFEAPEHIVGGIAHVVGNAYLRSERRAALHQRRVGHAFVGRFRQTSFHKLYGIDAVSLLCVIGVKSSRSRRARIGMYDQINVV